MEGLVHFWIQDYIQSSTLLSTRPGTGFATELVRVINVFNNNNNNNCILSTTVICLIDVLIAIARSNQIPWSKSWGSDWKRSIFEENRPIFVPHYNIGSPKLWGRLYYGGGGACNCQNTVWLPTKTKQWSIMDTNDCLNSLIDDYMQWQVKQKKPSIMIDHNCSSLAIICGSLIQLGVFILES